MNIRLLVIIVILFSGCISCEKVTPDLIDEHQQINYCINYIKGGPDTILLSNDDLNVAKSLFEFNKLDYSHLQFYRLDADELGYHHVRCYQYINGLKIFSETVIFHFKADNTFYTISGHLITSIDLDTIPAMRADSVVKKFLCRINEDDFYKSMVDSLKSGCYDLEFGYYDLIRGDAANYTKAWKVNFKDRKVPFAYINDSTSSVIYYDNGIRY